MRVSVCVYGHVCTHIPKEIETDARVEIFKHFIVTDESVKQAENKRTPIRTLFPTYSIKQSLIIVSHSNIVRNVYRGLKFTYSSPGIPFVSYFHHQKRCICVWNVETSQSIHNNT